MDSVFARVNSVVRHLYVDSEIKIMKNLFLVCAFVVCLVLTVNVQAQDGKITNSPKQFNQYINGLITDVRSRHEFYILNSNPSGCGTSLNERIRCRNKAIRDRFEKFKTERRAEYNAYRFQRVSTKSCTVGRRPPHRSRNARCYERVFAPQDHIFIRESLTKLGDSFGQEPTFEQDLSSLVYMIQRHTRGRSVGGVNVQARYRDNVVTRYIETEIAILRQALRQVTLPDDLSIDP